MIQRIGGVLTIECESCSETEEDEEHDDFHAFWGEKKQEGWIARKHGQDWVHYCPACAEEHTT